MNDTTKPINAGLTTTGMSGTSGTSGTTGTTGTTGVTSGATGPTTGGVPGASSDAGRTLLVGVLGGLVSAAGYLVYQRLPDEQRDRLNRQVRNVVESRVNELRDNFKI